MKPARSGHAHARQPHHFHHGWLCGRAHLVARIRSSRWIVFWDAINAPISRPELIGSYKFWLRPVAGVRRTELHAQPERALIPSRRLICIGASRMLSSLQVLIRRARRSLGRAKAGRGMRRTLALVLAVIGTGAVAGSPPVPGARPPANSRSLGCVARVVRFGSAASADRRDVGRRRLVQLGGRPR